MGDKALITGAAGVLYTIPSSNLFTENFSEGPQASIKDGNAIYLAA